MSKQWDKALPDISIWKECFRVLKAGAFMFVMCIPRSDCQSRMIIALEEAGFITKFSPIYWTYASGFPKAMNISKAIDKKAGVEREVVGYRNPHLDGNLRSKTTSYSFEKSEDRKHNQGGLVEITEPATEQAKQFDGSYGGCQLKPAVEIILVVMKPLTEKTFVDQALDNGKGVTWLDDCRIPFVSEEDRPKDKQVYGEKGYCHVDNVNNPRQWVEDRIKEGLPVKEYTSNKEGRFPSHLLVSDDVLNDGETYKSGQLSTKYKAKTDKTGNTYGKFTEHKYDNRKGDSGSFSRYFDLDKWFTHRLQQLPERVRKTFPFVIQPKADKEEKNRGCEDMEGQYHTSKGRTFDDKCSVCGKKLVGDDPYRCQCPVGVKQTEKRITKGNFHPTCKPIKLMTWLVTLGSRKGDIILDPFAGSGTTCIASKLLERHYIGCEIDENYYNIAESRLKAWDTQLTLFE